MPARFCGVGKSAKALMYFLQGFSVIGDFETSKFDFILGKLEFLRVEGDAMCATDIQRVRCLEEAFLNVIRP